MKILILLALGVVGALLAWKYFLGEKKRPEGSKSRKSIYEYSFTTVDGKTIALSAYKGKKILIVNVASECGFTPQYEGLEKLYKANNERLVILGFPANDFGGQEPGTNDEIATFCRKNYGVTFPIAQKSTVTGEKMNEIFRWLTDPALNGWNNAGPKWNFSKYLLSEEGELMAVYPSTTKPESKELSDAIAQ